MANYSSNLIVFGGLPSTPTGTAPTLHLLISAQPTIEFRRLRARGVTDGTNIRAVQFSVGRGGFDPNDYLAAAPVNYNSQVLDESVFTDDIDHVEWPNPECLSCYCVLDTSVANTTLGEIAIIGEVSQSPGDPVDGSTIVMAIGHFPILAKNSSMRYALRVTVQA